jgi:hypothetical protein
MATRKDDPLAGRIFVLRGQRVVSDAELARLYGVKTGVFNQAIRRNARRFPADFAFQLSAAEVEKSKSQIVISIGKYVHKKGFTKVGSRASVHRQGGHRPWVFPEHGAVMAANVLRSARAVEMSVYVVRAFVRMREELAANATILKRLAEIDRTLLEHDSALRTVWQRLQPLLAPPPEPPQRRMGFHVGNG